MKATLNLHKGFALDGIEIDHKTSMFPGGEVYVEVAVPKWCSSVRINSRCNSSEDVMRIIMTTDAIRRSGVKIIDLFIPYLPYSRQDRVCEKGEAFSLKVMCQLLESCRFNKIYTYDNHSDVAEALLDNLYNYNNHSEVNGFMDSHSLREVLLIAPDAGAAKKAQALCRNNYRFIKVVQCNKQRIAGKIEVERIMEHIKGRVCVVVDDICDGGRTFIELAEKLKESYAGDLYLFVSHGIFSAGFDQLKKHYKSIGSTNSIENRMYVTDCITFPIIY